MVASPKKRDKAAYAPFFQIDIIPMLFRNIALIASLSISSILAWPAPEKVVIGDHTYSLLRYELTPSQVQSYGKSKVQWWGALREIDNGAPAECDGFMNNGAACAPFVHNIIGLPIKSEYSKAPALEVVKFLLDKSEIHY